MRGAMAKKKDCFGSETYVCRTQNCPYVSECVQVVWEKKLQRVLARKKGSTLADRPAGIRVRSKEFLAGS
jgi:hypothetical protein